MVSAGAGRRLENTGFGVEGFGVERAGSAQPETTNAQVVVTRISGVFILWNRANGPLEKKRPNFLFRNS